MNGVSFLRLYAWGLELPLSVQPSEQIRVAVRVEGVNVPEGSLNIAWDPEPNAVLLDGGADMELPAGDYKKVFNWLLEARTRGRIWIDVRATAGSLPRLVQIPVDVT